jgi:competence CoiA-like predicted nuclease
MFNYKTLIRYALMILTGYWAREQYISLDMQEPLLELMTELFVTVAPAVAAYAWNAFDKWRGQAKAMLAVEEKNLPPKEEAVVKAVVTEAIKV